MRSFLVYGVFLLLADVRVVAGSGASPGYIPPKPTVNVHVYNYTLRNYPMSTVRFTCDFTESSAESLYYRVSWWREGVVWYNTPYASHSSNDSLFLTEELFVQRQFKLGEHIACSVIAYSAVGSSPGNSSETSTTFFAGITILTPSLSFDIGEKDISKRTIRLQPTVPVGCYAVNMCSIWLTTHTNYSGDISNCTGYVIQKSICGVAIRSQAYSSELHIPVTTAEPGQYPSARIYDIFLKTDMVVKNLMWSNYHLPPIKVQVAISKTVLADKSCSAFNPGTLFRTFDDRMYDIHQEGVFTLYRHTYYDTEIQIHRTTCDPTTNSQCICGVAARAGQDRYVIDVCNGRIFLGYMECRDSIIEVARTSDHHYKIVLPQGTFVEVTIYEKQASFRSLSVNVVPSVHDGGAASRGLCGQLDSDCVNDFHDKTGATITSEAGFCNGVLAKPPPLTFINIWKVVSSSEDLFHADFNFHLERPWVRHVCGCEPIEMSGGVTTLMNEIPCRRNTVASCTHVSKVGPHSFNSAFGFGINPLGCR